jgi:hypothetical protein
MSADFPVVLLCDVLEIGQSSFYEWKAGLTYQDNCKEQMIEMRTIAVFWENKRRYGARRVAAVLPFYCSGLMSSTSLELPCYPMG